MNNQNNIVGKNLQKSDLRVQVNNDEEEQDCSNILTALKQLKFIPKRLFLKYNKCLANLKKIFNLNGMTIWIYQLNDNYKFHHFNIGITIPKTFCKKAVCRTKLKRKIKCFFIPFLQKNKKLFIWVRVRKDP